MKTALILGDKPFAVRNLKRGYEAYHKRYNFEIKDFIPFCLNRSIIWKLPSYDFAKYNSNNAKFIDKYAIGDSFKQAKHILSTDIKKYQPDFIIIGEEPTAIGTFEGIVLLQSVNWPLDKMKRIWLDADTESRVGEALDNLYAIDNYISKTHVKLTEFDRNYREDNPFKMLTSDTDLV